MKVTLWKCQRCELVFASDNPPTQCPSCRLFYSGTVYFKLAGNDVQVDAIRTYGKSPLAKPEVQAGLHRINIGCRCPHGWLHKSMCESCLV